MNNSKIKSLSISIDKKHLFDLVFFGSSLLVLFSVFLYGDIMAPLEHSSYLIDAVVEGKLFDFYQIVIENSKCGHPAVYDLPIYIVFAIWNLPSYVISKMFSISLLDSTGCLLWAKALLLFAGIGTLIELKNISKEFFAKEMNSSQAALLYMSSLFFTLPVFIIAQYDILSVFLMLWGLHEYLKGNHKRFIWVFLFANTMKLFSIFIFVPLLVLKEKNVLKILRDLAIGLVGVLFFKVLFWGNSAYIASTSEFSDGALSMLFSINIPAGGRGYISLFLLFVIIVCGIAYSIEVNDEQKIPQYAIYICFAVFGAFVAFVPIHTYWMLLVAPFSTLLIASNSAKIKINLILETLFSFCLFFVQSFINSWIFGKSTLSSLILKRHINWSTATKYSTLKDLFCAYNLDKFLNVFNTLIVACFILMIVINFPRKNVYENQSENKTDNIFFHSFIYIRLLIISCIAALMVFIAIRPADDVVYNSISTENVGYSENISPENHGIKEYWKFDKDVCISCMKMLIQNDNFQWIDSAIIKISVFDENGNRIISGEKPVNTIKNNMLELKVNSISLNANKQYTLEISCINGKSKPVYVWINRQNNMFDTVQNDTNINGNICLQLIGK